MREGKRSRRWFFLAAAAAGVPSSFVGSRVLAARDIAR
jgi:hypothetical protein